MLLYRGNCSSIAYLNSCYACVIYTLKHVAINRRIWDQKGLFLDNFSTVSQSPYHSSKHYPSIVSNLKTRHHVKYDNNLLAYECGDECGDESWAKRGCRTQFMILGQNKGRVKEIWE